MKLHEGLLPLRRQYALEKKLCFLFVFCMAGIMYGQNTKVEIGKNLNYRQQVTPSVLDNYLFSTFYSTGKKTYNLKGFNISSSPMNVQSIKVNPAGASYAVLSSNGKGSTVEIYDTYEVKKKLYEFRDVKNPTAIAYSANSRNLYIATDENVLNVCDSKTFQILNKITLPFAPTMMVASANGYYLAIARDQNLSVLNAETGNTRSKLNVQAAVHDITFSDDCSLFGVLAGNTVTVYNTRTFEASNHIALSDNAASISFHPENKYLAIVTANNTISFANLTDESDRPMLSEPEGNVSYVRFLKDGKHQVYLSYNSYNSIKYKQLKGFSPNYTKMLREELAARMEEWSKIRDGESVEEYKLRVSEENRIKQARLYEQEIATRMADDLVMSSNVTLGGYNPSNNMLTLNFDNMPPVYLTVPEKEVQDFMDAGNLEFRNAVYGLTKNDKFELIYADVYNKLTGKTYAFNNLNRQSLDFLSSDENFVPIELVQQSGMEEVQLNSIKKGVVDMARQNKLISEHTHIAVNTKVVSDIDATGKKITNYKVGFNYTVEGNYSIKEDFAAGKYKIEQSNAAVSMLKIVTRAFETDFAQYLKPGKKVIVKITGSADAIPINGTIPYDGCYGEYENEPYYLDNNLSTLTVAQATGIKKNEQLAFMRAVGVKNYIEKNVRALESMATDYRYLIELSDKTGGEYRRINVEFTFVDAF